MREVTVKDFLKHLERFGPDGVLEGARDHGLNIAELVQLQEAIDARPRSPKHRKSAEARVRDFLGLPEEEAAA